MGCSIKRLALGLISALCLASLLHFSEEAREIGEPGTDAQSYVIAKLDFSFPDEEATALLKSHAAEDIGAIYKIEPKQLPNPEMEEVFAKCRFADEHTLKTIHTLNSSSPYNFYSLITSEEFWRGVEEHIPASKRNFQKDVHLERALRKEAQEKIEKQFTFVKAGSTILSPGEKITPKHLAMEKSMREALKAEHKGWEPLSLMANILYAFLFLAVSYFYLKLQHSALLASLQKLSLLVSIVIGTLLFAKGTELLSLHVSVFSHFFRYPVLIPFASLLICILLEWQVALFGSALLTVILGLGLSVDFPRFIILNLLVSFASIFVARNLHKRREVFAVCAKAFFCSLFILLAFSLYDRTLFTSQIGYDILSSFIFLLTTALLVSALLPVLESTFHVTTDMALMEYMDPNHVLLRRLSSEAPGTYQHSLVVGNLAENAARAIGARGLLCRVSALYHDIGKLFNPHYFTENQLGGFNIHQLLTPQESAAVIIAHVKEGEALARKHRLPQSFIDVILQHHGTTLVYYFFCKHKENACSEEKEMDCVPFRYKGPKPQSKEAVILMIADTVEACSRSLEEYSEKSISEMVERLVGKKAEDGQFEQSPLSFEELERVKKSMVATLLVSGHWRVKYPTKA